MDAQCRDLILIDDGVSKLWGRNVGEYPLNHFVFRKRAGEAPLPLNLSVTGYDEWIEGCARHRLNSRVFSIEFVKEGRFEFVQEGRTHIVEPGAVFLVRQGCENSMRTLDAHAVKRVMIVEGPGLELILSSCGLGSCDVVRGVSTERLDALFDEAKRLFLSTPPSFFRKASTVVYESLLLLGAAAASSALPPPVRRALELFEGMGAARFDVKDLARKCACSPVTLQRLFRKSLGQTPRERLIAMKMELAKGMLSAGSDSIKEISRKLGYGSQLHFSTEFRRRVGASPRQWRNGASRR
jgi:AraC-like DNA-binding protein